MDEAMRPTLQDIIERAWNEIANLPDNERPKVSANQLSIELAREYEMDGRTPQQREETLKADIDTLFYAYSFALRKLPRYWNPEPIRHKRAYNYMALCLRSILCNLLALTSGMGLYLPQDELQRYEGIELWVHDIQPFIVQTTGEKPHPEPQNKESREIQGSGKETPPEALKMENLPTIFDDEETKQKEQRVFYNAIMKKWMKLNESGNGYIWDKTKGYNNLAYMCGKLYCHDDVITNRKEELELSKGGRLLIAAKLKMLFGGVDVGQNRSELFRYQEPPKDWRKIDILFKG
jgi:hypothetical protein